MKTFKKTKIITQTLKFNKNKFKKEIREFAQEWFENEEGYQYDPTDKYDFEEFMNCATDIVNNNIYNRDDFIDEIDDDLWNKLTNYYYVIGQTIYNEEKKRIIGE